MSDQPARQSRYYYQLKIVEYRIRIAAYRLGGAFTILPARDGKESRSPFNIDFQA